MLHYITRRIFELLIIIIEESECGKGENESSK